MSFEAGAGAVFGGFCGVGKCEGAGEGKVSGVFGPWRGFGGWLLVRWKTAV